MRDVKLTASYFLTTDHAKSRLDQPVLFNKATGQAYLPSDIFAPYESWPMMQASQIVNKMASWRNFSGEERQFIARFIGTYYPGPGSRSKTIMESGTSHSFQSKWPSR